MRHTKKSNLVGESKSLVFMKTAARFSEHIFCNNGAARYKLVLREKFVTRERNAHNHEHEVTDGQINNQDVRRRPHQWIKSNNWGRQTKEEKRIVFSRRPAESA